MEPGIWLIGQGGETDASVLDAGRIREEIESSRVVMGKGQSARVSIINTALPAAI